MLGTLWSLFLLIVLFSAAAGVGVRISSLVGVIPAAATRAERFLISTAIGLGVEAFLGFGLGLAGWLYPAALWAVLGATALLCWRDTLAAPVLAFRLSLAPWKAALSCLRRAGRRAAGLWLMAALLLAGFYSFCLLLGALSPPADNAYDVLTYHFTVPSLYLRWHGIRYNPYILHSNFPQLMEMLYLYLLAAGAPGAQVPHFALGALTCGVCWTLARRHGAPGAAVAILAFWFVPVVGWEATVGYDDLAFAFFEALAFLACVRFSDSFDQAEGWRWRRWPGSGPGRGDERWLILGGIAQGLALGVKYSAMAFIPLLLLFCGATAWRQLSIPTPTPPVEEKGGAGSPPGQSSGHGELIDNSRRGPRPAPPGAGIVRSLLIVGIVMAVTACPWYIRTILWTGNPVFPYYYSLFGGRNWSAEAEKAYRNLQLGYGTGHGIKAFFLAPWRLLVWPNRYYEPAGHSAFGSLFGCLGTPFLLLTGITLLRNAWRREAAALAALFGLFFVEWFLLMQQVRYLIEALPLLAPACALALFREDGAQGGVASRRNEAGASGAIGMLHRLPGIQAGLVLILSFGWMTWAMVRQNCVPVSGSMFSGGSSALMVDLGLETRGNYLQDWLGDLWPVSQWVNENVPDRPGLKVALIGEPRGYYMHRDTVWADGYEQEKLRYSTMHSAPELVRALRSQGIAWIVVRLGTRLGLVAQYGRFPKDRPANWSDIDYPRPDAAWLALYATAVRDGLLVKEYPDGAEPTDAGGYAVYAVTP